MMAGALLLIFFLIICPVAIAGILVLSRSIPVTSRGVGGYRFRDIEES